MRDAFSNTLVALAKADPNVLLLTGDHGYTLFDTFRRECPKQYINAGIAEQNMIGMAAGLARAGFNPFVYGLAAFIPIRVIEQIKLDIAHDNLPVVFIGDGAGFVYSHLGTSHQSLEDIACTRAIPNLSIYSPSDRFELAECMNIAYAQKSPIYIRVGKSDRGDIHSHAPPMTANRLINVKTGEDSSTVFIATGSLVRTALNLALTKFTDVAVYSAPFIKPINIQQVVDICKNSKNIIVFEEHSDLGGFGSLICEIASEFCPKKILRVGTRDRFSHFCGSYDYLLQEHGLDCDSIENRILKFMESV